MKAFEQCNYVRIFLKCSDFLKRNSLTTRRRETRIDKTGYDFLVPIYGKCNDVMDSNMVGIEKIKILNSQENKNIVKTKYQF